MKRFTIACVLVSVVASGYLTAEDGPAEFKLRSIGQIKKSENRTLIVLNEKFQPGLLGVDGYSHIYMFWWFDKNDTPEGRSVLQVHPRGNPQNPLTGVFATRSPRRPNLIALTLCKVLAVKGNVIEIEKTDAFDGTPVLDIKPFIPGYDTAEDATVPEWLEKASKLQPKQADSPTADEHAGLRNVMRVSDRIYSGSEPSGASNVRITSANNIAFIPASPTLYVRIDIAFQQNLTAQAHFFLVFDAPNQAVIAV